MKDDINKELEGLSPKLAKLRKIDEVPEIPKNLFHNMQLNVIQELKEEVKTSTVPQKNPWWKAVFKPVPALAFASFLALIAIGIFFNSEKEVEQFAIEDISEEEILAYIDSNIDDFESTSLIEITDDEDDLFIDTDYNDEELNEYLDNNFENLDDDAFEQLF